MTAEQIRTLFTYNNWAWKRLFASVEKFDDTAYMMKRPLFFHDLDSIHAVLVHCMSAERRWLSRCLGHSPAPGLVARDYVDFTAVRAHWTTVWDDWTNFLRGLDDEDAQRPVTYHDIGSQSLAVALIDVVQHVVNHATEHRSQLMPVLHHLGLPAPPLDYITFRTG
jgi:uncharacterized damage-inducible protein DinB